jgi:hypothetical protein
MDQIPGLNGKIQDTVFFLQRVRLFTTFHTWCLLTVFMIYSLRVVAYNLLTVSYTRKTELVSQGCTCFKTYGVLFNKKTLRHDSFTWVVIVKCFRLRKPSKRTWFILTLTPLNTLHEAVH